MNIFGQEIIKVHCDNKDIYTNEILVSSVKTIFNLPVIKNRKRGDDWDSHYGEGETTEIVPYLGPAYIPGSEKLTEWVTTQVNSIYGNSKITRSWMNRLLEGSQGRCHNHYNTQLGSPDIVAIFYIDNPENGSQLVIIDKDYTGILPSDIPESNKQYIPTISGDLIMHGPNIWHAVSEHKNSKPRICFVYQFNLI
jgi:hypothetical protein